MTTKASKPVLLILSVVVLGLAGCQQVDRKLADGIRRGVREYYRRNLVSAESILTTAISHQPNSPAAAEAYYLRGLTRNDRGHMRLAEQDFIFAMKLADREDIKTYCRISLGSIAYNNNDFEKTYEYYRKAVDHLPKLSPNEWIIYKLAVSAQKIGKWGTAKKYFARLIHGFPGTEAAKLSLKRMNYDHFTIQVGVFGRPAGVRALVAKLKAADLPVRTATRQRTGLTQQVVNVGRYKNFNAASQVIGKVKKLVPDARIVP